MNKVEETIVSRQNLIDRIKELEAENKRLKVMVKEVASEGFDRGVAELEKLIVMHEEQTRHHFDENKVLREALPDGDRLIQLAAWIDLKYPDDDTEVQEDLRRWGYGIKALKEQTD